MNLEVSSRKSDWYVTFLQDVKNVIGIAPGDSKAKLTETMGEEGRAKEPLGPTVLMSNVVCKGWISLFPPL